MLFLKCFIIEKNTFLNAESGLSHTFVRDLSQAFGRFDAFYSLARSNSLMLNNEETVINATINEKGASFRMRLSVAFLATVLI